MSKQLLTDRKTKLSSFVRGLPWKRSKRRCPAVSSRSLLSKKRYKKQVPKCRLFRRQTHAAGRLKFSKARDANLHVIKRVDNNAVRNLSRSHQKNEKYKEGKRNIESNTIELCQKTTRLDKWQEGSSINKKDNDLKTRCLVRPNLSDVQSSNFRIRLYYQLNVVQSRSKKLSVHTRGVHSAPARLCSHNRKHEREVHRSMPITIDMGQSFVRHAGYVDRRWAEYNACRSTENLDTDDIFTLDI